MTKYPHLQPRTKILIPLVIFLAYVTYMTLCQSLNSEDLHHMVCVNFLEAFEQAKSSYLTRNARIGEMSLYFIGISSNSTGAYFAQIIFYFLNPIFLLLFALLSFRLGTGKWPGGDRNSLLLLTFTCLAILDKKQDFFWLCGNTSWMWPTVLSLLFFYLWEPIFSGVFSVHPAKFFLSLPLTFIAGMSNENTSLVSVLLFCSPYIYYCLKKKKLIYSSQYIITIFLLLAAFTFYSLSPSRGVRAHEMNWTFSITTLLKSIFDPNCWLYTFFFYWRSILIFIFLLFFILKRRLYTHLTLRTFIILFSLICLWGVLTAAPCWGAPRSFTPLDVTLVLLGTNLLHLILSLPHSSSEGKRRVNLIRILIPIQVILSATVIIPRTYLATENLNVRNRIRQLAEQCTSKGERQLVVRKKDLISPPQLLQISFPRFIFENNLYPCIPLISISKEDFLRRIDYAHRHVLHNEKGYSSTGDDVLNHGVAKRFGLESIIYVSDN
ncbi:MAG: DUF6056 family protein [Akkermansia muciniphila]